MTNSSTNYSYIEGIVYSKQFRSLQDKTQLFYSSPKRQVRTRLTHTIEVKIIAHDIGQQINKKANNNLIDLNLVEAIALAHDIGHTPFGHVGERTINDIVSKKDNLGGLIRANGTSQIRFKHNVNSMRILEELNIQDWRIIDGALCHTRIFYKNDENVFSKNPYNPFEGTSSKIVRFIYGEHGISFDTPMQSKVYSLTLEGQIVSIADEVAQRIADISDGLESRYFEKVKNILSTEKEICTRTELEQFIREILINDVVDNTIENLKSQPQNISGTYVPGSATSTVYYVDITWGSMEFTYTDAAKGTWNPQDHTYDNSTAAAWSCADGANKITVTNHSNAPVKATLKYETATGFDAITGTFDKGTLSLATAVGTAKDNAPAETALLTLSGALSKDTVAKTKIGTVTVTLGSDN